VNSASFLVRTDIVELPEVSREFDMSLVRQTSVAEYYQAILVWSVTGSVTPRTPYLVCNIADLLILLWRHCSTEVYTLQLTCECWMKWYDLEPEFWRRVRLRDKSFDL
jgi:hypothetical protein